MQFCIFRYIIKNIYYFFLVLICTLRVIRRSCVFASEKIGWICDGRIDTDVVYILIALLCGYLCR